MSGHGAHVGPLGPLGPLDFMAFQPAEWLFHIAKAVEEIGGGSWAFCMQLEASFCWMLGLNRRTRNDTEESEDRRASSLENICERIRGDAWPDWNC